MPTYEYQCKNCHQEIEAVQKITEDPLKHCSACGKEALIRVISGAGFQLKGEGWYVTDFKTDKKNNVGESNA